MSFNRVHVYCSKPGSRDYAHRRRTSWAGNDAGRLLAMRLARYGITTNVYQQRVELQDGKCAICNQKPSKPLVIDHDHASGEFRELLCGRCNIVLGLVRDDAQICRALAQYLDDWQPVVKGDTMASTVSGSATP